MSSLGGFNQTCSDDSSIEKCTPWVAASDGNLELVKNALNSLNMSASTPDENGYTLLHAAAAYNQVNILEWLMTQEGVDVNAQDTDGDTPLHHADTVEAAKFLIEKMMADPAVMNADEKTAFQVRHEELKELMSDDEEDEELKKLVDYLRCSQ